jgi:hypothetical protein
MQSNKEKQAEEKRAEEEKKKKSDLEKAASNTATVSLPTTINDIAVTTEGLNLQPDPFSDLNKPWTEAEDNDILTTHGISPNHLFGKEVDTLENTPQETVDLTAEILSPLKKKTKSTSSLRSDTRYTTNPFSLTPKIHAYAFAQTFLKAAITLKSEDKPKEFIAAIKLLLTNGKFQDTNFALAPLKHNTKTTKPKLILMEVNIPLNFTHLGQYAFTSGNRIFEKKKNWKGDNSKKLHQDQELRDDSLCNPIVYFTIAIATDIPPCTLISGMKI